MRLQARPKQARVNALRLDSHQWSRFQALARKKGWVGQAGLRQLILQYQASPFPLHGERQPAGDARTAWFECDASAVAVLQKAADKAGIKFSDALRELIGLALRAG
ncbi:MAG: hypothetical protein ACTHOC_12720 [Luteimonas sp.]